MLDSSQWFSLADPFALVLQNLAAQGLDLARVLWVMPRLESEGRFKSVWLRHVGASVCVSPRIQTADRLSQTASQGLWLNLQDTLVGLLKNLPNLCGGLSTEQLWTLSNEYLELALRLVMLGQANPQAWQNYLVSNRFAAQEVQVVVHVAQTFEAELLRCVPQPQVDVADVEHIVWFDDAELMPALWFQRFFPNVPVLPVRLPQVEGPQPWVRLAGQLAGRVKLSLARDEAAQAQQAADQVLTWLRENDSAEVAIAVLDRLAARRLVAVLAELGVLVDDRTGWRLSTSNVAGWFEGLLNQHVAQGQISNLDHPFTGVVLDGFEPWARTGEYRLAEWAAAYEGLLNTTGLEAVLHEDEAGRQLLAGLRALGRVQSDVRWDDQGFLAAWRHWAEGERFRPLDIESPVRLVPLLSTRLRQFQRVLVLGCAQSHLQESPPGLLPPTVAQELGFPGPKVVRIQKLSALYELLHNTPQVRLVHAEQADGKPQTLLPELQWLDIALEQGQTQPVQHGLSPLWLVRPKDDSYAVQPEVTEPLSLSALPQGQSVPQELRVTALDDWVACPLRFGLKHALPWPDNRPMTEGSFEQLRGILVHKVLEKTAQFMSTAKVDTRSLAVWKQVLLDQGKAEFHRLSLRQQSIVHPFMAQFELLVPRIAGRLMNRQMEGRWTFSSAEAKVEGVLPLPSLNAQVVLKGRLDRMDQRGEHLALSDIKFKKPTELKKQAADPLSAPQLPMYQRLIEEKTGLACRDLSFLAVHKDAVDWIEFAPLSDEYAAQGFTTWGDVLFAQIQRELDTFFAGEQAWPAQPGEACTWCDVKHVCRPNVEEVEEGEEVGSSSGG